MEWGRAADRSIDRQAANLLRIWLRRAKPLGPLFWRDCSGRKQQVAGEGSDGAGHV